MYHEQLLEKAFQTLLTPGIQQEFIGTEPISRLTQTSDVLSYVQLLIESTSVKSNYNLLASE